MRIGDDLSGNRTGGRGGILDDGLGHDMLDEC